MERKYRAVLSGVGACVALGLFLGGVPVCLVMLVGNPLPSTVPEWSSVVAAVEAGALPPGLVSRVLAVAVWIWWSQVALSFVAEVWAARRGRTAWSLPLRGLGMQPLMMRLVAVVVAAAGTFGALAQPVLAATPSFVEIAVPMNVGGASGEVSAETMLATAAAGVGGSAPAVTGSPQGSVPAPGVASAPILAPPQSPAAMPPVAPERRSVPDVPPPVLAPPETSTRPATATGARPSSGAPPVVAAGVLPAPSPAVAGITGESQPGWPLPQPVSTGERGMAERADRSAGEPGEPGWVVVKPGDSLWLLAQEHLGDALRWRDLFELNEGQLAGGGTLRDPNLIHPGWRLRLPSPETSEASDPAAVVVAAVPAAPADAAPR